MESAGSGFVQFPFLLVQDDIYETRWRELVEKSREQERETETNTLDDGW
jgi:hypothetical protein